MWTHENRPKHNRDHLRYPSDLTDDEWAYVEPLCCESFAMLDQVLRRALNAALVFAPLAQPFRDDFLVARKGGSCQLGSEAVAWFGRVDASSRHLFSPSETTFTDAKAVRLRCA